MAIGKTVAILGLYALAVALMQVYGLMVGLLSLVVAFALHVWLVGHRHEQK